MSPVPGIPLAGTFNPPSGGSLPNFAQAGALGFAQGQQMAGSNPLGDFIKMMLANKQEIQTQQRDIAGKVQVEQAKAQIDRTNPESMARTEYYKSQTTSKDANLIKTQIMQDAYKKYQAGDRSSEVLKALDMYVTPPSEMEQFFAGLNQGTTPNPIKSQTGRIQVKRKSDGQIGNILEKDFDPTKYTKV